jgi:carboxypeptidase Taq
MNIENAERRLYDLWGEIRDLQSVKDLLDWDQETYMPTGSVGARAKMAATMAAIKHQRMTSPELLDVLAVCAEAPAGSVLAAQVRCAHLQVDRAVCMPESLVRALAEASATGGASWQKARAESDFSIFENDLRRLVDLRRQEAAALQAGGRIPGDDTYDAMLHRFEPGATETSLAPLFRELRDALTPLVRSVAESGAAVDESPASGDFPEDLQERFSRQLATAVGFDFDVGRIDRSTHPFCIGINPTDVRMTWRCQATDFRSAVFGVLHESGHGLYEQGLPAEWIRTPICDTTSLGIHESQSRLWENHVGRSRGFWRWAFPRYRDTFPDAPETDPESLWPLLHTVRPSLIRVEADEATYNLHVIVRFEIERKIFAGELEVEDLPAAWDDLYEELLGIRPENAAEGVLQDVHWSQGMFGYFPTYTLGNVIAAQLYAAAERDLGDLEELFADGEFRPLLAWMRDKIHRHGGRYEAAELVRRATGKPLEADDLLAYLRRTTAEVYGARV